MTNLDEHHTDFLQNFANSARSVPVRRDAVLRPSEAGMAIYGIFISSGLRFDIQKY